MPFPIFNPAMLATNTDTFPFAVDNFTITRYTTTIVGGAVSTAVSTIYSGLGDLQEGRGDIFYNAQGAVEEIDARLFLEGVSSTYFQVDDRVTNVSTGRTYDVVAVANKSFPLSFVELTLKRGPLRDMQK